MAGKESETMQELTAHYQRLDRISREGPKRNRETELARQTQLSRIVCLATTLLGHEDLERQKKELAARQSSLEQDFKKDSVRLREDIERQQKELAQRQAALEEEFRQKSVKLRGEFRAGETSLENERDRQVQSLAEERHRLAQELASERSRLEQAIAQREAELVKARESESAALQASWTAKQNEWLAEHQGGPPEKRIHLTASCVKRNPLSKSGAKCSSANLYAGKRFEREFCHGR